MPHPAAQSTSQASSQEAASPTATTPAPTLEPRLEPRLEQSAGRSADVGQVWSLDASGLDPKRLAGEAGVRALQGLFEALIEALDLHPIAEPIWHLFGGEHAGVTGIVALSESHLACHSFPEHGGITLDLYTCTSRPAPDWEGLLQQHLGGDEPVRLEKRVFQRSLHQNTGNQDAGNQNTGNQNTGPSA